MNNNEKKNVETENLIDPFMQDDDQTKAKKAEIWQEIFLRCPEFADFIIDFYDTYGEEGLNDLIIMYNTDKKKFELGSLTPPPSYDYEHVEDGKKEEE